MTLVVSWAGLDQKKEGPQVSSIYFAADSRFSWPDGKTFDEGLKVFCSSMYPYIFAYCGDVIFPSISLERIVSLIDSRSLFGTEPLTFEDKKQILFNFIESSLGDYPYSNITFSILFASREGYYEFHMCDFCYDKHRLIVKDIDFPPKSGILCKRGSGTSDFDRTELDLRNNNNEGTSRYYYHCIAKAIEKSQCPSVGGMPQLVGLFRKGNGIVFGIEKNGERFILGKKFDNSQQCFEIQWRNDNFERINPDDLKLIDGAQAQPF